MSLNLSAVEHGADIYIPIGLVEDCQFAPEPNTSIGVYTAGDYKVVTTSEVNDEAPLSADTILYRAKLEPAAGSDISIEVVVKMAMTENSLKNLIDEGRFYASHLGPLVQQSIVPICYGAYTVLNHNNPDQAYGCLILQDCGRCLRHGDVRLADRSWGSRAENIRASVLSAVRKMHQHGILHGDLQFHHITLMDDMAPRIIGFNTNAATGHKCQCKMEDVELWGIPKPLQETIGCHEIYSVCSFTNIFVPDYFDCFDRLVPVSYIDTPDADLEAVADYAPEGMDPGDALQEAYEAALLYFNDWFSHSDKIRMMEDVVRPQLNERRKLYKERKVNVASATLY